MLVMFASYVLLLSGQVTIVCEYLWELMLLLGTITTEKAKAHVKKKEKCYRAMNFSSIKGFGWVVVETWPFRLT